MKKIKKTLSSSCVDGGGGGTLVLRRGAWTQEEDNLLRQCIGKYGEGKWHLVPFRAGLKRCRKSCRLRWLNYLRPHIKRGDFGSDEVDLIVRLHNLLGNRWSLIAGRIPGRTANDVKNYWNTHLRKKLALPEAEPLRRDDDKLKQQKTTEISILRPRPTYARNLTSFIENNSSLDPNPRSNNTELAAFPKNHQPSSLQLVDDHIEAVQKVDNLMFNDELESSHEGASASASAWPFTGSEEKTLTDIWNDGLIMQMPLMDDGDFQEAETGLGDFLVDHTMEDMGKYSFWP